MAPNPPKNKKKPYGKEIDFLEIYIWLLENTWEQISSHVDVTIFDNLFDNFVFDEIFEPEICQNCQSCVLLSDVS